MEPRRLWRRYLVGNTRFILLVFRQYVRERLERVERWMVHYNSIRGQRSLKRTGVGHEED